MKKYLMKPLKYISYFREKESYKILQDQDTLIYKLKIENIMHLWYT